MRTISTLFLILCLISVQNLSAQDVKADSLFNLAIEIVNDPEAKESHSYFERAAEIYLQQKDTVEWVRVHLDYGEALVANGKVRDGLSYFLKVDELDLERISMVLAGTTKSNIGWAYRKLEQYRRAQEYYKEGIKIAEQTKDSLLIGRLNNNISYTYQNMGDYETALKYQKIAKRIYEDAGSEVRLSYVLNGIFLTFNDLGLHEQAAPYIRQSLAIREELNDRKLLDVSYHNMAWSYYIRGVMDSAVIYYNKSLEISRELNNPYEITETLNNIGLVYSQTGNYEMAIQYYKEALSINREINRPSSIALNLINLGNISIRQGELESADRYFTEALEWMQTVSSPKRLADLYLKFANLKQVQGKLEQATEYIDRGMEIAKEVGLKIYEAEAHSLKAKKYELEERWQESLVEHRKAYQIATELSSKLNVGRGIRLARAYHRVDSDSAWIISDRVFSEINSTRNNIAGLTFKAGYFSEFADFYNEVAMWHILKNRDIPKALELVESAKARVLMDELAEAENRIYDRMDDSLVVKRKRLVKDLDATNEALRLNDDEQVQDSLRDALKDQNFRYQTFLNEMRTSISEWKDFKYPTALSASEIKDLLDPDTGILEYAFSDGKLIRFLITESDIQASVVDSLNGEAAHDELAEWVRNYREAIAERQPAERLQALSGKNLSVLMPSIEDLRSKGVHNLLVIPAGPLSFLPFEALRVSGKYLIEELNFKYLPSASIYSLIQSPHRKTEFELLALAGSGFNESGAFLNNKRRGEALPSLPSTLLEVDSISTNFDRHLVLKNEQVSEKALKSLSLEKYKFIHFATHAEVNEENPSQSGLIVSGSGEADLGKSSYEDGYLNRTEISGLKLNAELTTLSACNTGMGELVSGEGLLGLQRSFLSAGTSSVMVSLWSVFDRSTADFMTIFYRNMLAQKAEDYGWMNRAMSSLGLHQHPLFDYKSSALRSAKLSMIEHPYYKDPVYWAPFVLIGK